MTTVINNPGNDEGASGALGVFVGIIVLVLVVVLFFLYGLPMIKNLNVPSQEEPKTTNVDIKVTIPKSDAPQTQPNP